MNTYSHWDVLLASKTEPLSLSKREYQIGVMKKALQSIETAESPSEDDWDTLSILIGMMESLRDMQLVQDPDGALNDAVVALGKAGSRSLTGKNLRLDGPAIGLMRGILEDYESVGAELPARTMIAAHRGTEKRRQAVLEKLIRKERTTA